MTKITFDHSNNVLIDGKRTDMYVREGSYRGTTDDRLGRWYIGSHRDSFFRPFGFGWPTRKAAAEAAIEERRAEHYGTISHDELNQ